MARQNRPLTPQAFEAWLTRTPRPSFSRVNCRKCALGRYLGTRVEWHTYGVRPPKKLPPWADEFVHRFTSFRNANDMTPDWVSRKQALAILRAAVETTEGAK